MYLRGSQKHRNKTLVYPTGLYRNQNSEEIFLSVDFYRVKYQFLVPIKGLTAIVAANSSAGVALRGASEEFFLYLFEVPCTHTHTHTPHCTHYVWLISVWCTCTHTCTHAPHSTQYIWSVSVWGTPPWKPALGWSWHWRGVHPGPCTHTHTHSHHTVLTMPG